MKKRTLGIILLCLLFGGLFMFFVYDGGIVAALATFGLWAGIICFAGLIAHLITSDD
jgi:hypothetical protein